MSTSWNGQANTADNINGIVSVTAEWYKNERDILVSISKNTYRVFAYVEHNVKGDENHDND